MTCVKTLITTGRDCGLAEWINLPEESFQLKCEWRQRSDARGAGHLDQVDHVAFPVGHVDRHLGLFGRTSPLLVLRPDPWNCHEGGHQQKTAELLNHFVANYAQCISSTNKWKRGNRMKETVAGTMFIKSNLQPSSFSLIAGCNLQGITSDRVR